MNETTKQKLREAGREDLIKIHYINQSGYAGILPTGGIVDRREYPEAIPVQKNSMLGIPAPKPLVMIECMICGKEYLGGVPEYCCSEKDCGCMGMTIEPPVCSKECYDKLLNNLNELKNS